MADTFDYCVLPVSSFSKDDLASLKGQCEKAMVPVDKLATVAIITGATDFIIAMSAHNWRKHTWKMLGVYSLGLVCISFVGLVIADALVWSFVPIIAALLCLLPLSEAAVYKRQFDKQVPFQSADISKDFICFHSPGEIRRIKHTWISDIDETKRCLRLYVSPNVFFLLPKDGFSSEQLSQFRSFLRSAFGAPS